MMKINTPAKLSSLNTQKIEKKRSKNKPRIRFFVIFSSLGLGLLMIALNYQFRFSKKPLSKHVVARKNTSTILQDPIQVNKLERNKRFSQVSIAKSWVGQSMVQVKEHKPVAKIKINNSMFFLDSYGALLDEVHLRKDDFQDLIVLSGVHSNGGLDRTRLKEAFVLLKAFSSILNLNVWSELVYDEKYGFLAHLSKPRVSVVIGVGDYETKVERLRLTLSKLKNNEDMVSVVDLDFKDRVIVKFKGEEYFDGQS